MTKLRAMPCSEHGTTKQNEWRADQQRHWEEHNAEHAYDNLGKYFTEEFV